jgi:hypothetical protein
VLVDKSASLDRLPLKSEYLCRREVPGSKMGSGRGEMKLVFKVGFELYSDKYAKDQERNPKCPDFADFANEAPGPLEKCKNLPFLKRISAKKNQ